MTDPVDLDTLMRQFRLASRELFNHLFRIEDPYENDGWTPEERFRRLELLLFDVLVIGPAGLDRIGYGDTNRNIRVALARNGESAPIMLNRGLATGYWDHPTREVGKDVGLAFVTFFDWDVLGIKDNQYVKAEVVDWPEHPELSGKRLLVEAHYVRFEVA
jgi:hypothetical protein